MQLTHEVGEAKGLARFCNRVIVCESNHLQPFEPRYIILLMIDMLIRLVNTMTDKAFIHHFNSDYIGQ
jgi:hypothetical protein